MKFLLLLLLPVCVFSQTLEQRKKIIDSYDTKAVAVLKEKILIQELEQKTLIREFKLRNPFVDSEQKSLQRIFDGIPYYYSIDNEGSALTMGVNTLYLGGELGLDLSGENISAGVWDGGKVRTTHQELTGRMFVSDASTSVSSHGTHVTGTIAAQGVNPSRKGMAYKATVYSYDWTSDYSEMFDFASFGFLVSNHSYGTLSSTIPTWGFGAYNNLSLQIDQLANTFPYYQVVKSAGNDRNDATLEQLFNKGGFDLLTGFSTAKNVLTVAAVNQVSNYQGPFSVEMSSFSNWGPTDDGRIKPDISAKGVAVTSSIGTTDTAYDTYNGTSMASPAITGLIVLLQEHYSALNPDYMKSCMVRGLLCHSAKESGANLGPDYEFGWGLADGKKSAQIISSKNDSSIIELNVLQQNETFTKTVSLTSAQKLMFTISWTDPVGTVNQSGQEDNRTPRLKNNLDLKILKDGVVYFPWKLDPINPFLGATRESENDVDNIERVEIDNAQPGVYTIQVTHKNNLVGGSQEFALIGNSSTGFVLNTRDYDLDNSVFVYPNPAENVLNYDLKDAVTLTSLEIFDITGKVINTNINFDANTIDVSSFQSGVYFVKFTSDDKSVVKKFIKK